MIFGILLTVIPHLISFYFLFHAPHSESSGKGHHTHSKVYHINSVISMTTSATAVKG
jgi:hypothetical protein